MLSWARAPYRVQLTGGSNGSQCRGAITGEDAAGPAGVGDGAWGGAGGKGPAQRLTVPVCLRGESTELSNGTWKLLPSSKVPRSC